jgi:probable rRNA maturation factor
MPTVAPGSTRRLRAVVTDGRGRGVAGGQGLARWLSAHAPRAARGEVGIALVSDARMRVLNRTYRGQDRATDVLSFPTREAAPRRGVRRSGAAAGGESLGDIVIATGVARRQARDAGHPTATELKVLALHGLLHLLGYDHERDAGAMARAEQRWLRRAGLPQGLIAREGRR